MEFSVDRQNALPIFLEENRVMWHLLAGASYLGSSTYNGSLLPAIAATCVPLDPIGPATAGRIRIEAMFRRAHDMGLVFAEKGIAVIQDEKTFSTLIIAERPKQVRTSKKWNAHLEELEAWSIITKIKKSEAEGMASYFAVFKTTTSARAIFNGKRLSTCFAPPPPRQSSAVIRCLQWFTRKIFLYYCGC